MISSAEITIYLNKGENSFSFDLSSLQLEAIIKLLGLEFNPNTGDISMLSDKSLQLIMDKTINRFKEL